MQTRMDVDHEGLAQIVGLSLGGLEKHNHGEHGAERRQIVGPTAALGDPHQRGAGELHEGLLLGTILPCGTREDLLRERVGEIGQTLDRRRREDLGEDVLEVLLPRGPHHVAVDAVERLDAPVVQLVLVLRHGAIDGLDKGDRILVVVEILERARGSHRVRVVGTDAPPGEQQKEQSQRPY